MAQLLANCDSSLVFERHPSHTGEESGSYRIKTVPGDVPGGPMIKTLTSNAEGTEMGTKIPRAQKNKRNNRSNTITNSIKSFLKMIHTHTQKSLGEEKYHVLSFKLNSTVQYQ